MRECVQLIDERGNSRDSFRSLRSLSASGPWPLAVLCSRKRLSIVFKLLKTIYLLLFLPTAYVANRATPAERGQIRAARVEKQHIGMGRTRK
jgi:hypothetical protein